MQVLPAQQPLGHDVASHTQAPLTQRWPALQAGPVPQVQAPFVHESAFVEPQATQAAPLVPQLVNDGVMQLFPAQHPLGHDVASHTQAPLTQLSPELPQARHTAPPRPHCVAVGGAMQLFPEQQPLGHDVASQTQIPLTHRCPALHAAPVPQVHAPFVQESAWVGSHTTHDAPPVPQVVTDGL
jgi:hypothetical protein